jgi:hypothetical protein
VASLEGLHPRLFIATDGVNALFIAPWRLTVSLTDVFDRGIKGLRIGIALMIEPIERAMRLEVCFF